MEADVYIVYGVVAELRFKNPYATKVFVALEPPEIFTYHLPALQCYDYVLSPSYGYLKPLQNVIFATGLLNWTVSKSRLDLENTSFENNIGDRVRRGTESSRVLTVVMSLKTVTPIQRVRIDFVKYLVNRLPELKVYGREIAPLDDKWQTLVASDFHLAIENSLHEGYWTEKLADSVLSGTKTLYVGDPSIAGEFSEGAVVPLNIGDFEEALHQIRHVMDNSSSKDDSRELMIARRHILDEANIHSRILSMLDGGSLLSSSSNVLSIAKHPISLQRRVRFMHSNLRSRVFRFRFSHLLP